MTPTQAHIKVMETVKSLQAMGIEVEIEIEDTPEYGMSQYLADSENRVNPSQWCRIKFKIRNNWEGSFVGENVTKFQDSGIVFNYGGCRQRQSTHWDLDYSFSYVQGRTVGEDRKFTYD